MTALPEIEFGAGALAIGDAHLDASSEPACAHFCAWLANLRACPALAVVGDLFDAWIGPAHLELDGARAVTLALSRLSGAGTRVELIHGNRDFLLDASFEHASGARIHPRGFVAITPGGERTLLVHGDELCTLDRAYQRYKRMARSAAVRWLAEVAPRRAGLAVAKRLRATSVRAVAAKPAAQKAQQASAVRAAALEHRTSVVLCGHAHVARDEALEGGPRWLVVGAFGSPGDVLRLAEDGRWGAEGAAREPQPLDRKGLPSKLSGPSNSRE